MFSPRLCLDPGTVVPQSAKNELIHFKAREVHLKPVIRISHDIKKGNGTVPMSSSSRFTQQNAMIATALVTQKTASANTHFNVTSATTVQFGLNKPNLAQQVGKLNKKILNEANESIWRPYITKSYAENAKPAQKFKFKSVTRNK